MLAGGKALLWLLPWSISADLQRELYNEARKSDRMIEIEPDPEAVSEFLKNREQHVVMLLHDQSCPHCRQALPELDRIAEELKGQAIAVTHVDCSSKKSLMKEHLGLRGFPTLAFWRSRSRVVDEDLVGKDFVVDQDANFVLRASRLAGISEDRDKGRLALLGKTVTVRRSDQKDLSVQVEGPGRHFAWLPQEVLRTKEGQRLPYQRAEGIVKYNSRWEKPDMLHFIKHMMQPAVRRLPDFTALQDSFDELDVHPAFVYCGTQITAGVLELAATHALSKVFHTTEASACPVPGSTPRLVVYSPASQQWSAMPGQAKAAVAVAGPEVATEHEALIAWAAENRYPGIYLLGYRNFQEWLRGGRSVVLVAINMVATEENRVAEAQLRQLGQPQPAGDALDKYSYQPEDRYLGVTDGTLEGLSAWGVQKHRLPRAVVFLNPDEWVENERLLTAQKLASDVKKIPLMFRQSSSPRGFAVWMAQEIGETYLFLDRKLNVLAGTTGRIGLIACLLLFVWLIGRVIWKMILAAIGFSDRVLAETIVMVEPACSKGEKKSN
eukprot:TRINITY_DN113201_c0_g1_i1.p1 TRINITY_DN113201_c0_g1~~TRINITY_DN113201_c0_g1_i1.p1  ORF type:complete len:565 (-),score=107.14 TRINITY_DN113201_c0_g1_i1:29-1684(-)